MSKRVVVLLGVSCVLLATSARSDDQLAFLLPGVFGPQGLKVDSLALLPSGETHSAHFNNAFQSSSPVQRFPGEPVAAVPPLSPASGFTHSLDSSLVAKRSTELRTHLRRSGRRPSARTSSPRHQLSASHSTRSRESASAPSRGVHTRRRPTAARERPLGRGVDELHRDLCRPATALLTRRPGSLDISLAIPLVRVDMTVVGHHLQDRHCQQLAPTFQILPPGAPGTEEVQPVGKRERTRGPVASRKRDRGAAGLALGPTCGSPGGQLNFWIGAAVAVPGGFRGRGPGGAAFQLGHAERQECPGGRRAHG